MNIILLRHKYGGMRPGEYRLVTEGYDYFEVKWQGGNICVPRVFFEDKYGEVCIGN
jgi:hypothetical protein